VRREVVGRDLLGEVEDGIERLAGVLGEPRTLRHRFDVEPLVQQEVEITAGQDQGRRHGDIVALRATPRSGAVPTCDEPIRHACADPYGAHSARPIKQH